jgi:hypothetical protein
MVSVVSQGDDDRAAGDSGALASGWLSSLLALEIAGTGRAAANQRGAAHSRVDVFHLVVISRTVKDLVAGSGIVFDDIGEHAFKGFAEKWQLF